MRQRYQDIEVYDDEGNEIFLPSRRELCHECNGDGRVDHPAFSNGITASEWAEDWCEEERDSYLSGAYDVQCPECNGNRWVLVPDLDACSEEEKQAWEKHCEYEAYYDAEIAAERRFGC